MGLPGPQLKQRCAFEDKLFGMRRLRESVQQAFQSIPRQNDLKLVAAFAGEVHQSLADGSRYVAWLPAIHAIASR